MGYTVKLSEGKIYNLTNEDADKLKEQLITNKRSFLVDLGGDVVKSTRIVEVTHKQVTEADKVREVFNDKPQLVAGKVCYGSNSIQHQINLIAKDEGGNKWQKLIQDKKWRGSIRMALRETDKTQKWCDNRASECACEALV